MWVHRPTRAFPHHHQWALRDPKLYASFVTGTGTGWGQDKEEGIGVQVRGRGRMSHAKGERNWWQMGRIYDAVKRVGQRKTSGSRGPLFCGLRGSISESDPANVMWESQQQITAENYRKAFRLFQDHPKLLLLAQPNHHSYSCLTYCWTQVRKIVQLHLWTKSSWGFARVRQLLF